MTASLIGCWLMNEGTGNKVYDMSGNRNDGTFGAGAASPSWATGKYGHATSYDGGDNTTVADSPSIQFTSPETFTVAAWMLTRATGSNDGFIGNSEFEGGGYMLGITAAGDLIFILNNDAQQYGNNALITVYTNTWYYVVGVYDGINSHIYIDGVLKHSMSASITPSGSTLLIGDGQQGGWDGFNGQIDNAMLFNRALSASEIALLYREPFCFMAEDLPVEMMYEYAAPPPSGSQVIMIQMASIPFIFIFGIVFLMRGKNVK